MKDQSGIVIGLIKEGHMDVSMKTIKAHSVSLNGKGFAFQYNVTKVEDYKFDNSTVKISVVDNNVSFFVADKLVGTSILEDVQYRFAVWIFYSCIQVQVDTLIVEREKGDDDINVEIPEDTPFISFSLESKEDCVQIINNYNVSFAGQKGSA